MNRFLAFDCGATSGRAVLATFEGVSRKTIGVLVTGIIVLIVSTFLPQII